MKQDAQWVNKSRSRVNCSGFYRLQTDPGPCIIKKNGKTWGEIMQTIVDTFERNKSKLYFALASTFFWGLLAHAYCFFDNSFSHDSLNELHGAIFGNNIKLVSGRIFVPLYRDLLRSDVTLPWLIGFLSLLWIGLAVFLVLRIFRVESKLTGFLVAGIFSVNISVSATAATYIHDLDCDMFALMCAVGAVWLWKERKWGVLPGAVLLTVSMGMYQSFLFVGIGLIMLVCILDLLDGARFAQVFSRGMRAVGMILLGGGGYYGALQVSQKLSGIALSSGDYNSLDLMGKLSGGTLLENLCGAYRDFFYRLMNVYTTYPSTLTKAATAALMTLVITAVVWGLMSRRLGWREKLLLLALALLLPLGLNMIYVLTLGASHDLMVYGIWVFYLVALLLSDWLAKQGRGQLLKWQQPFCMLMVALILYGSVQFANGMYLKKDQEYDAYLSMMTRVVDRMETCEGYTAGQTPVVFAGMPQVMNQVAPGFMDYWNVTGMLSSDVIFMPEKTRYQAYFDYVLGLPLLLAEDEIWMQLRKSQQVQDLPQYPAAGCVQLLDGVLIVKLGPVVD